VIEDRNPDPSIRLPPGFPRVPPKQVETSIDEVTPYLNLRQVGKPGREVIFVCQILAGEPDLPVLVGQLPGLQD
jgi:hypothetical protein